MKIVIYLLFSTLALLLYGCAQSPYSTNWNSVTQIQSETSKLQIGDVLVKEEGVGFEEWFGHSAIYLGNDVVLEAPNPQVGVIYNYLSNWPTDLGCIVLRYQGMTPQIQQKLLDFATQNVNKPYIISFNKETTTGYSCSSLIYAAYDYATNKPLELPKNNILIVMPYDFLYSPNFKVVKIE